MSRATGRGLFSRLQNAGFFINNLVRDNLASMPRIKPTKRSLTNRAFHRATKSLTTTLLLTDASIGLPSRELKDHLGPPHFSCLRSRSRHFFQFPPLMRRQPQPCR
jgi:hypothetical protein